MSLLDTINDNLKDAMRAKDAVKLTVLRQIKTVVKNTEIKQGKKLSDEEIQAIVFSLAKSHNESIESFKKASREDLIEIEEKELVVLKEYLPEQLSDDELKKIIEETIEKVGASAPSDMGKVMGAIMGKVKGKADGSKINVLVKEALS